MKDVFRSLCGCEGPANDPDRDKKGKAVEQGPENAHRKLKLDVVRGFMGLHVVGESRVDGPPVASYVQDDEEEEEEWEEYLDSPSLSLVEVKNLMQGIPPSCDDPIHFQFVLVCSGSQSETCLCSSTDFSQASMIFMQVMASSRVDRGFSPFPITSSRKCCPMARMVYG